MRRKKQKNDRLINIGLIIGSLLVFITLGELFLRLTGLETTEVKGPPIYQKNEDPRIGYELKPNISEKAFRSTITTNELGFRGPELKEEKPVIAVLGDSITFGYGVEDDESFPAKLQEQFPEYEIVNMGVPGYNMDQEVAVYETKAVSLDPTAAMLLFYFNDLNNDPPSILDETGVLRPFDWTPEQNKCTKQTVGALSFIPGSCWLNTHSTIFIKLKKIANLIASSRNIAREKETSQEEPARDAFDLAVVNEYEKKLDRLVELMPAKMPRVFVIVPDFSRHPVILPQLIRIAKERGFLVVDLYEVFGTEGKTLGWDAHPHPDMLKQAAEYVAEVMKAKNILSEESE